MLGPQGSALNPSPSALWMRPAEVSSSVRAKLVEAFANLSTSSKRTVLIRLGRINKQVVNRIRPKCSHPVASLYGAPTRFP